MKFSTRRGVATHLAHSNAAQHRVEHALTGITRAKGVLENQRCGSDDAYVRERGSDVTKNPIKKLGSELERSVARAWEALAEGWREVLVRGSGSLTHFVRGAKRKRSAGANEDFPQWALLAGESWETAKSIIVKVEIPGIRKEDIDVSIYRGGVRIRGEKRSPEHHEGHFYHLMERAFGRFERTIPLPDNIDAANAEVSYQDGVLTVIVPKTRASPPTQLPVK